MGDGKRKREKESFALGLRTKQQEAETRLAPWARCGEPLEGCVDFCLVHPSVEWPGSESAAQRTYRHVLET